MSKSKQLASTIKEFFNSSKEDAQSLGELKALLEKARRRMSDEEQDPDEAEDNDLDGMREFNPDEEGDDADKWLEENDPEQQDEEQEDEPEEYNEYEPGEDEESHQQFDDENEEPNAEAVSPGEGRGIESQSGDPEGGSGSESQGSGYQEPPQEDSEEVSGGSRFRQPSKGEMAEMRQYTRPWEDRARDKERLEADASKNPVLHHEGRLVEARNAGHKEYQDAYKKLQGSKEYNDADPITQMEMDTNFEKDWHKNNPDYLSNAAKLHSQAHLEGLKGMSQGAGAKKESIQHVRGGGAQAENPMSVEAAMQHAGGQKGEEGTTGSMIQDPSSKFANNNQNFLRDEGAKHEGKAAAREATYNKKAADYAKKLGGDIPEYKKGSVQDVLGDHPGLKDPKNKAKMDKFFEHYHPLINMSAHKVLNKLGLDKKSIDMGQMHEAGMHGLFRAVNDYEHDNPSKASFATHAGNKIRGLMQTALRDQQQVPQHLASAAKKYNLKDIMTKHPPERADRMTRVNTAKAMATPKVPKAPAGGEGNEQQ
jgi:hypothetical protein